jgi:hypothetical protein
MFVIVALVCLLVGVSGAAMAVDLGPILDSTCPLGVILTEVVDNLTPVGNCLVQGSIIMGDVTVNNATDQVFVMRDTIVNGGVRVIGGSAVISKIVVVSSNLVVRDTTKSVVQDSLVAVGNMRFVGNEQVLIRTNVVPVGAIRCVNNIGEEGQLGEFATQNLVPSGVVTCFGQ